MAEEEKNQTKKYNWQFITIVIISILLLILLLNEMVGMQVSGIKRKILNNEVELKFSEKLDSIKDLSIGYDLIWEQLKGGNPWKKNAYVPGTIYLQSHTLMRSFDSLEIKTNTFWRVPLSKKGLRISKSRFKLTSIELLENLSSTNLKSSISLLEYINSLEDSIQTSTINTSFKQYIVPSNVVHNLHLLETQKFISQNPLDKDTWIKLLLNDTKNVIFKNEFPVLFKDRLNDNTFKLNFNRSKVKFGVKHIFFNEYNEIILDSTYYSFFEAYYKPKKNVWETIETYRIEEIEPTDYTFLMEQSSKDRVALIVLIAGIIVMLLFLWVILKIITILLTSMLKVMRDVGKWILDIATHVIKNEYKEIFQFLKEKKLGKKTESEKIEETAHNNVPPT